MVFWMNKTAVVTGGARGIGRACVEELARSGYDVIFTYKSSAEAADSLCRELRSEGCRAEGVRCDVSDPARVNEVFGGLGYVRLLVNNAGVSRWGLLSDMTDKDFDDIFNTNVRGVFLTSRALLPSMIREKSGCIINVSSIWGIAGASCEVLYSASKHAVAGFTRALAKEVGPSGIRVNAVAPGIILTDMTKGLGEDALGTLSEETPLGRIGRPSDIARVVKFLASEEASFITGQVVTADGGFL